MTKRWVIAKPEPALTNALAGALGLPAPLAQTLVNRGCRDAEAARQFLNPQLRQLSDPFELPDMKPAVERISAAIAGKERIVIYGDYDVDGVTATALLCRVLEAAGATIATFLPHRMDEGYGLSADGIARCLREHKPRLLIAVDCGTTAVAEISNLKSQGVDVIVLDHHEPGAELPDCVLVNPKRAGGEPLASVGVAFKLAHALLKSNREWKIDLREHLDLAAIGTVADIVPLIGQNRILVRAGLERLPATGKIGLRALMDIADVPEEVTPYHIGFRIGPRLNAAGRLADARAALELLLTRDAGRATELAKLLNDHNAARQRIEEQIVEQALAQAEQFSGDRVLVLAGADWHPGIIGIVASRVLQERHRPTVIIGADGKGSCRSVAGFNIVAALTECAPLLERFGGHEMAAGLTVKACPPGRAGNIGAMRKRLNELAGQLPAREVAIDAVVRLDELDYEFFRQLAKFEPCGPANPKPVLAATGLSVRGSVRLLKNKHLKFSVTDGETTAEAIWWNAGNQSLPAGAIDVAFVPEINEYRGAESVQLNVRDVRPL